MTALGPLERGKGGRIIWTDPHDAAIRHVYREGRKYKEVTNLARQFGVRDSAIPKRAKKLGIKIEPYRFRVTEEQKARIIAAYTHPTRSANKRLAIDFGWPDSKVSEVAAQLGLEPLIANPREKTVPWSQWERVIVIKHAHLNMKEIRAALSRAGYRRTHDQIKMFVAKLVADGVIEGSSSQRIEQADYLTTDHIITGLGVRRETIATWIKRGLLTGIKGAGDKIMISPKALRRFLVTYRAHWRPYFKKADMDFVIDIFTMKSTEPAIQREVLHESTGFEG